MDERTRLSDEDERLVDAHLATGDYASREEVVRAALRKLDPAPSEAPPTLEECAALIEQSGMDWTPEALQAALRKGLESGPATRWDYDEFLRAAHERHGR